MRLTIGDVLRIVGAIGVAVALVVVWGVDEPGEGKEAVLEGWNWARWGFGGTLVFMIGDFVDRFKR